MNSPFFYRLIILKQAKDEFWVFPDPAGIHTVHDVKICLIIIEYIVFSISIGLYGNQCSL